MTPAPPTSGLSDVLAQADQYEQTYTIVGRAHYLAAEQFGRRHRWLSLPVIILTTVVGTSIFGSLNQNPSTSVKVGAGLLSLVAAVLAALQTHLGYGQRAERHRASGARYRAITRDLILFRLEQQGRGPEAREAALAHLKTLHGVLETTALEAPDLDEAFFQQARSEQA